MWQTVDAIKHRLLYCHSIAVENPMAIWMSEPGGNGMMMALTAQNGVFVQSGAIVIVEESARNPILASVSETTRAAAEAAGLELGQYVLASREMELAARLRSRAPGRCDLDLSNPFAAGLVRTLAE